MCKVELERLQKISFKHGSKLIACKLAPFGMLQHLYLQRNYTKNSINYNEYGYQ